MDSLLGFTELAIVLMMIAALAAMSLRNEQSRRICHRGAQG